MTGSQWAAYSTGVVAFSTPRRVLPASRRQLLPPPDTIPARSELAPCFLMHMSMKAASRTQ